MTNPTITVITSNGSTNQVQLTLPNNSDDKSTDTNRKSGIALHFWLSMQNEWHINRPIEATWLGSCISTPLLWPRPHVVVINRVTIQPYTVYIAYWLMQILVSIAPPKVQEKPTHQGLENPEMLSFNDRLALHKRKVEDGQPERLRLGSTKSNSSIDSFMNHDQALENKNSTSKST